MPAPTLVDLPADDVKARYNAMSPEDKARAASLRKAGRSAAHAVQIVEAQNAAYMGQQPAAEQARARGDIGEAEARESGAHALAFGQAIGGGLDTALMDAKQWAKRNPVKSVWLAPALPAAAALGLLGEDQEYRTAKEKIAQDAPGAAQRGMATGFIGGLVSGAPVAKGLAQVARAGASAASSLPMRIVKAAAPSAGAGAAMSGTSAASQATGGPGERLAAAAPAAALGGAVGGAAGLVGGAAANRQGIGTAIANLGREADTLRVLTPSGAHGGSLGAPGVLREAKRFPGGIPALAQKMRETGISRGITTARGILGRAQKLQESSGQRIGQMIDDAMVAGGKVDARKLAQSLRDEAGIVLQEEGIPGSADVYARHRQKLIDMASNVEKAMDPNGTIPIDVVKRSSVALSDEGAAAFRAAAADRTVGGLGRGLMDTRRLQEAAIGEAIEGSGVASAKGYRDIKGENQAARIAREAAEISTGRAGKNSPISLMAVGLGNINPVAGVGYQMLRPLTASIRATAAEQARALGQRIAGPQAVPPPAGGAVPPPAGGGGGGPLRVQPVAPTPSRPPMAAQAPSVTTGMTQVHPQTGATQIGTDTMRLRALANEKDIARALAVSGQSAEDVAKAMNVSVDDVLNVAQMSRTAPTGAVAADAPAPAPVPTNAPSVEAPIPETPSKGFLTEYMRAEGAKYQPNAPIPAPAPPGPISGRAAAGDAETKLVRLAAKDTGTNPVVQALAASAQVPRAPTVPRKPSPFTRAPAPPSVQPSASAAAQQQAVDSLAVSFANASDAQKQAVIGFVRAEFGDDAAIALDALFHRNPPQP